MKTQHGIVFQAMKIVVMEKTIEHAMKSNMAGLQPKYQKDYIRTIDNYNSKTWSRAMYS